MVWEQVYLKLSHNISLYFPCSIQLLLKLSSHPETFQRAHTFLSLKENSTLVFLATGIDVSVCTIDQFEIDGEIVLLRPFKCVNSVSFYIFSLFTLMISGANKLEK